MTGDQLLAVLAVIGVYVVSLYLHPRARCRSCTGAGCHRGAFFTYSSRPCGSCSGRGRGRGWRYRVGAVLFGVGQPARRGSRQSSDQVSGRPNHPFDSRERQR